MNREKYEGDYRLSVSDKGNISFTLNWKWLVSILIPLFAFIGWLLIDKYYSQPMYNLKEVDRKVEQRLGEYDKKFEIIIKNQSILLDRSERMMPSRDNNVLPNNDNTHLPFENNLNDLPGQ